MVSLHDAMTAPPRGEVTYVVRQPNEKPPGGWWYRQPETGRQWSGTDSLAHTAQDVAGHRMYNALDIGDPEADIMHETGFRLVQCGYAGLVEIRQPVKRTLGQYWKGIAAYGAIRRLEARGVPITVDQATAEARASVCSNCKRNAQNTKPTFAQRATDEKMRKAVGGGTTSLDEKLGSCTVCSCHIKTLVFLSNAVLAETGDLQSLSRYPTHCWKRTCNP